jgi:phosphoribosyl 1,2-cyclic phosphodiesterase
VGSDLARGITVRFWGVRGSIPAPGPETCRYGGNTACVEVRAGEELLILDAGTGIRKLGLALSKETAPVAGTLLISHAHWDHIHGLPFFAPAMATGNSFRVYGCAGAAPHMETVLAGQMESPYFPISMARLPRTLEFHELNDDPISVGEACIRTTWLHHPGLTLGFRIEVGGRALVYATDHEPLLAREGGEPTLDPALVRFTTDADLLICDAQYTAEEYRGRVGWGHSSVTDSVRLALAARVRRLALYHHDPERSDADLDVLHAVACAEAARRGGHLDCFVAAEGLELQL